MNNTGQETPQHAARRLAAKAIRDGFAPEALHAYTDHDGKPLHWCVRLKHPDTGDKWIRPMKLNGKGFELGEPEYSDGKPLYRLQDLAARPHETVVVCEGEWCADALMNAGVLATTSGAADSAVKANWRPLAGRNVTIWPDNDEAGRRYAVAVAEALLALGCVVQVIDVDALGLEPKADAVDWLAANQDATAADVAALARIVVPRHDESGPDDATTTKTSPDAATVNSVVACRHGNGRFEMSKQGVSYIGTDKDGLEKEPLWVCSRVSVLAKTRDAKSGEWGRLLEWHDDDGVPHRWAMPLELLEGDGTDVRRELARLGLHIATTRAARDLLAAFLKRWPVEHRARCVDRLGWHGPVFATPTEAIGEARELVVFQNAHAIEPAFLVSGTSDQWRESVAALATGNTRLLFALSVAFAGALAGIVGEDSGGFHLRGASSSGKSTALRAAASVWGDPSEYVRLWRATTNGLEGLAALHNDGLLILDELSQIDPKEAGEAAYLLANGQGKARASRSGTARAAHRWRLLFLSAGEESLSALMARVGKKTNAGQEIRLADIEVDAGAGMGAFEQLHGHASPAAFALAIKDAAARVHGAVGLEWLRRIANERIRLADLIVDGIRQFGTEAVPTGATGQAERVARRFALVAVAGELATHYGLTGWSEGEAEGAAKSCFAAWLEGFGGIGNREERTLLSQVRAFFEAHGASRFEDINAAADQRIINRAGYFRTDESGGREYLVLPEAFKRELCAGLDTKAAVGVLVSRGWIAPGGDGRPTQKPRLPGIGTPTRVYVFTGKMWESEE